MGQRERAINPGLVVPRDLRRDYRIYRIRVCAPSLVGTYAFVNPVIAVFLGSAFAGEELNFRTICGAAVIVAAVALVVFFSNRPAKPPTDTHQPAPLSTSSCSPT